MSKPIHGSWLSWTLGVLFGVILGLSLYHDLRGKPALDEGQGMVTADAPAHASVEARIDTIAHENAHDALPKGDKLK
jgi:hypothetical protein